jgi:hypothetical protein
LNGIEASEARGQFLIDAVEAAVGEDCYDVPGLEAWRYAVYNCFDVGKELGR